MQALSGNLLTSTPKNSHLALKFNTKELTYKFSLFEF